MVHFKDLPGITGGEILSLNENSEIKYLITDSRKSFFAAGGVFFAIKGERHDGHQYILSLYDQGVRQFVVEQDISLEKFKDANFMKVPSSLAALQALARFHRGQFGLIVVGITGSNGKTIIKEWLSQLIAPFKRTIKNPHSYNSQIGVPLSVWHIESRHEVGIFEAGISRPGEMERLEAIIKPSIGIFSNIGSAHDSGFSSITEKVKEKALLFKNTPIVIYCKDYLEIDRVLYEKGFTWGHHPGSNIRIENLQIRELDTNVLLKYEGKTLKYTLPFVDQASIENSLHCIAFMVYLGYDVDRIQEGLNQLLQVRMRLELKRAINNCYLVDDAYNNDLGGLQVALEFLSHQKQQVGRSIILSDILQSGLPEEALYQNVSDLLTAADIQKLIAIGPSLSRYKHLFHMEARFYETTEEFLKKHDLNSFHREIILVKGARIFAFEHIVNALEEKIHGTQLEINLDALTSNLNFYRSKLKPDTRLMVMVKAFAYGSGSLEVANLLQFHRVDYLGVAYADEGVILRTNGIHLPIMVMNPSEDSFDKLLQYKLEPEVYNFNILNKLIRFLNGRAVAVHIKLDTGMHRLGFEEGDIEQLVDILQQNKNIDVRSIFSHLAGSDEATHNEFSERQAQKFDAMSTQVINGAAIDPLRHLLNSPGIIRFPAYHYDMVRLGIGLYGLEATNQQQDQLQSISRLKTIISQVKEVKKGETIGYGRRGVAENDMKLATIAIGYADGFSRAFSNGVGEVWLKGRRAPVIGNICMDMTMIDITGIDAREGDEVEIFGEHLTIMEVARKINTIPYEILTNVSQRVKRVYFTG
ncbi:Alanine racemase [Fulvivirga imtechensis AK7]|uniref:Alanine racemase n=1 Tax=Fulvivirga imtechensis AK7 TaxID=1237149 RepID=L8K040_9BACT|nr:bifunctional UDP-N-acetylmuramoyl-tripeptide:D-alanyl-D-alanine ligase/alanine racemase [Fulvivirga imtechensis]ELR72837.1 Alanine racemase [Fulvivirga imtechensis AK7]